MHLANRLPFELRHLQALDAVARNLSFRAAADELGYTQSAISQQIITLEDIVGVRLFDRGSGPRPVEITEAGRVMLRHVRAILARIDAASADARALASGTVGELRLGTFESAANRLLPEVLRRFRQAWPRVEVSLFESGSHDEIDERLEHGQLDVAFTTPPVARADLFGYAELLRDPYRLVVGIGHPLADVGHVELADLAAVDLVGYRVCRAHAQVERFLRGRGIEPRFVQRAEDNQLLQGLAASGVGAAIMPLLAIDLLRPDTVIVDIGEELPARRVGLLWHADRHRPDYALQFAELAQDVAGELARSMSGAPDAQGRKAALRA
jgi:DNA-binding transcriptional LysR family regulator